MTTSDVADVQARLDAKAYPPTHEYDLATLKPRGVLAERMQRTHAIAPGFFDEGRRFLDIGCSKGYYSLRALRGGAEFVWGIDTDSEAVTLCARAARALEIDREWTFSAVSFREWPLPRYPEIRFDRIVIGNALHYLFVDANGWDFVAKLAAAAMPGAQLLIEGPRGMDCEDMMQCIPPYLRSLFHRAAYEAALGRYFELVREGPSPSYTPDRWICLYRRREDEFSLLAEETTECGPASAEWVRPSPLSPEEDRHAQIRLVPGIGVCKVFRDPETNEAPLFPSVILSAMAPCSNGIRGGIFDGRKFVGWIEAPLPSHPLRYFEREEECFSLWCRRNVFLARNGYVDVDGGTLNYAMVYDRLMHFDKNSTMPVSMMNEERAKRLLETLRQSYRKVQRTGIVETFRSADSKCIERWCEDSLATDLVSGVAF